MLLQAARLARYGQDFALVERLVRAVGQPTPEAQLLLGEACYALARYAEAERVLAVAQQAAADQRQLAQIVTARADALTWGLLQPAAALAAIGSARARTTDPVALAELTAIEATVRMYDGQPAAVLNLLAPLRDHPNRLSGWARANRSSKGPPSTQCRSQSRRWCLGLAGYRGGQPIRVPRLARAWGRIL
jgi:hypothetical protein